MSPLLADPSRTFCLTTWFNPADSARQLTALCGDRWRTPTAIAYEGAIALSRTRPRRKSAPTLTVQQRRCEIIDLLAGHLARMPDALDIPPSRLASPPDSEHESAPQNLCESAPTGLELSEN